MSAPRTLTVLITRYVWQQDQPLTTASIAAAMNISTELAGSALSTARNRGYVERTDGKWGRGPVQPRQRR